MKLFGVIEGERISYLNEPAKIGRIDIADYRKACGKTNRDKGDIFPDKTTHERGRRRLIGMTLVPVIYY